MRLVLKRLLAMAAVVLSLAPLAWMQDDALPSLSRFVPRGAVVAIEARDFAALLSRWNASQEKQSWLAGDSYAEFSRSKLFLRLQEAQGEFAAAAGLAVDLSQLESVAGRESVLALYDIGELRALYVAALDGSIALETALLQSRLDLEPRRSAEIDYWVHSDADSGREIAFAVVEDLLFVSTDDALLGQSLELHAGEEGQALADEAWYPSYGPRGDLRMVEDLRSLVRSPHFRSYWLHGNITELSAFGSAAVDLFLEDDGIREKRRLVRIEARDQVDLSAAAVDLSGWGPDAASFVHSWASIDREKTIDLLAQKVLDPRGGTYQPQQRRAPPRSTGPGLAGGTNDLERRIDQPPILASRSSLDRGPLQSLLAGSQSLGLLHVQASDSGQRIVRYPSVVGIRSETSWNEQAALTALSNSVRGLWTTSGYGTEWQSRGDHYALIGLRSLYAATRGNLLFVADSEELLESVLARQPEQLQPGTPAAYRARFRHDLEADSYRAAMAHLDSLEGRSPLQTPRQPTLFSDNLGSLSRTLGRVVSVELERHEREDYVEESVFYGMR